MNSADILVFTDLDGTLLDHTNYSFTAAEKALTLLRKAHIPLIINTSKTRAEVKQLRRQLENNEPYICENGSAVFIPQKDGTTSVDIQGVDYGAILRVLSQLRKDGFRFRGFNDMTASEVTAVTGLANDDATMAKKREATEPLLWQGNSAELELFRTAIEHHNLRLVQGGRFWHVMNRTDKADGMRAVCEHFIRQHGRTPVTVALGDGENDRKMLEQADYPVVIPGKDYCLELNNPATVTAGYKGPKGWNQVMEPLITRLLKA